MMVIILVCPAAMENSNGCIRCVVACLQALERFFFFPCSWLCMDVIIELCFMCEVFISSIKCVTFFWLQHASEMNCRFNTSF